MTEAPLPNWQRAGFGLYLHWPFCAAKCPYCDFNSHVAAQIDQMAWRDAYLTELRRWAARTPERILSTVFFGGGTPSLMVPETVSAILDEIARLWPMVNDPEITLEANPSSVEAGRFAGFRAAGVNRVSLGVQALRAPDLRALGRLHDVKEAIQAIDIAHNSFERVSFDLIYSRQGQRLEDWAAELREGLSLAGDHLSLYQLTIEPGTAFGRRHAAGGLRNLPDEDLAADMYELTQDICAAAGLPSYEISNHGRPGAESRHNLIYWRGGDWVGIGPGAHGRLSLGGQRLAVETHLAPGRWLAAVSQDGHGDSLESALPAHEIGEEYLMMGLRLTEGCDLLILQQMGYDLPQAKLTELIGYGLLEQVGDRLRCRPAGRLMLNEILRQLMGG